MTHKNNVLPIETSCGCYAGGVVNWRTALVHYAAKIAGLHIKVEGMPLGTSRNLERVDNAESGSTCEEGR